MNEHMRRYLEEDWNEDIQAENTERERKPAKKARAQARRQTEKQRGQAIASFLRELKKQRQTGKP